MTIDRSVAGVTGLLGHVGADNVIGGEEQGKAIVAMFPDGADIIELLGTPGASPAIDRSAGLHNVIDPAGNINVVCQQTGEFNRDKGMSVTENCLSANPNAVAIVAANDDMALGAVEAAKAAGLAVPIIGFDALPEAIQAVNEGALYGSVEQFPGGQSRAALRTMMAFLANGAKPAKEVNLLSPKLITKENIGEAERIGEVPGMEAAAPAAAAPAEQSDHRLLGPWHELPLLRPHGEAGPRRSRHHRQHRDHHPGRPGQHDQAGRGPGSHRWPRAWTGSSSARARRRPWRPPSRPAIDAGIPVMTIDRSVAGVTGLLGHVGADNVIGGEEQGKAIVAMFPDGAKIIELLGTPGASPAIDRSKGLHNIIDPAGNIEVVCQQTGEFNRDKGLTVTENCLSANPDPDAIVAANDDMALGAVEAAKAAGIAVPIIGFDALPEAMQAVQAARCTARSSSSPAASPARR